MKKNTRKPKSALAASKAQKPSAFRYSRGTISFNRVPHGKRYSIWITEAHPKNAKADHRAKIAHFSLDITKYLSPGRRVHVNLVDLTHWNLKYMFKARKYRAEIHVIVLRPGQPRHCEQATTGGFDFTVKPTEAKAVRNQFPIIKAADMAREKNEALKRQEREAQELEAATIIQFPGPEQLPQKPKGPVAKRLEAIAAGIIAGIFTLGFRLNRTT